MINVLVSVVLMEDTML